MNKVVSGILNYGKNKFIKTVAMPIDTMVDDNITDVVTTIGSFVIRNIKGRFQRSITINVSNKNLWIEKALYDILYRYNKIDKKTSLTLEPKNENANPNLMELNYQLADGVHNMKYRKWNIILVISSEKVQLTMNRSSVVKKYTIITYDMDPLFMEYLEKDIASARDAICKITNKSPFVKLFFDGHESDGFTYWTVGPLIPKRKLNTIYLPKEQKKLLVDTINNYVNSKEFYHKHGIPWNLKILLYGGHGFGKSSITKMIASEWNRSLCEISGGKNGRFIPDAITSEIPMLSNPLFSISDIDKYPSVINEMQIDMSKDKAEEIDLDNKQTFAKMINALDGISSGEGKIIVMTTNHIEKFSDTFLRPGRIDLKMEIKAVIPEVFRNFTYDYYNIVLPEDISLIRDDISIAELQADAIFLKLTAEEFVNKYVGKPKKKESKKEDKK